MLSPLSLSTFVVVALSRCYRDLVVMLSSLSSSTSSLSWRYSDVIVASSWRYCMLISWPVDCSKMPGVYSKINKPTGTDDAFLIMLQFPLEEERKMEKCANAKQLSDLTFLRSEKHVPPEVVHYEKKYAKRRDRWMTRPHNCKYRPAKYTKLRRTYIRNSLIFLFTYRWAYTGEAYKPGGELITGIHGMLYGVVQTERHWFVFSSHTGW